MNARHLLENDKITPRDWKAYRKSQAKLAARANSRPILNPNGPTALGTRSDRPVQNKIDSCPGLAGYGTAACDSQARTVVNQLLDSGDDEPRYTFLRTCTDWKSFANAPRIVQDTGLTYAEARAACVEFNANRTEAEIEAGTKMEFDSGDPEDYGRIRR